MAGLALSTTSRKASLLREQLDNAEEDARRARGALAIDAVAAAEREAGESEHRLEVQLMAKRVRGSGYKDRQCNGISLADQRSRESKGRVTGAS